MATLSKSAFKPQVLAWLRRVEETGEVLVITDHGRPVVRIVPYREPEHEELLADLRARAADQGIAYDAAQLTEPLPPEAWGEFGGGQPR